MKHFNIVCFIFCFQNVIPAEQIGISRENIISLTNLTKLFD